MITASTVISMLFGLIIAGLALICMVIGIFIVYRWVQDRNTSELYGYQQSPAFPFIGALLIAGGFFVLISIRATMNAMGAI